MTEFVLCGAGWRAGFYLRVAAAFPDLFRIASVYTRRMSAAAALREQGISAFTSLDEALSAGHSAVIVASGREGFLPLMRSLAEKGENIITETSFLSLSDEELDEAEEIPGVAMEQYLHTPLYASVRKCLGRIGHISSVYLSALHNHHAASLVRAFFPRGEIMNVERIVEEKEKCLRTGSRSGLERDGETEEYTRKITKVSFRTGEYFINDFSSNQYHSYIIPSRLEIRGERGVLTERGVTYVAADSFPVSENFVFHRDSRKVNHTTTLTHVTLGSETLFVNHFYPSSLDDDEIAIASMLLDAAEGRPVYSIRDAVRDARLGKLL